jgi:hypothetical protein
VFETVIFQAVAHTRMRQRTTGVMAYFYYEGESNENSKNFLNLIY